MKEEIIKIKERLEKLEEAVFTKNVDIPSTTDGVSIDYSLNERAFIKKYASGFSGQQFFTLITTYIAKGKGMTQVDLLEIKRIWNSCFGIIKIPYASIFSTRAKENSWVDALKETRGSYVLGKNWQEIFQKYE
ncbi:hypothetical protein K8R42_05005 [bacterium]|nr:hypothetical protein [bacterium]